MIFDKHILALTTASGSASGAVPVTAHGLIQEIMVSPTTSTTTYDITLTDRDSFKVYERTAEVGDISEVVTIPIMGNVTVALANTSADELFDIKVVYRVE